MDIAIVGISCRLPDNINNLDDLYDKLINQTDCLQDHIRFNINKYYDSENNDGKINNSRGGYINNLFSFDNTFFKISVKEAKSMDPQQRNIMELIYECFIDGNINTDKIKGSKTGVFMGCCSTEYHSSIMEQSDIVNEYANTGGLLTLLSNRVSYFYDLRGPSITLDTACSSSGYALHLACQSLRNNETEQCLIGGANVILKPESSIAFSQATMLSPEGKCKSFDASANGYVRSEGFVTIMIKPLNKAIKDNNKIYAIIKDTKVNQDGKTPSITMPNIDAQIDLLNEIYSDDDMDKTIYIEAHGTGTTVGDKNEASAIGSVIGKRKKEKLYLGSIKSNIGHTEPTSGLASILKACLIMKYRKLIPNIHFNTPSPNIDFDDLNLKVVTEPINIIDDKFIIGINNFGFGGANFHCKLENYNKKIEENNNLIQKYHILPIHGTDFKNLQKNIENWYDSKTNNFMYNIYNQNQIAPLDITGLFIIDSKRNFDNLVISEFNSTNAKLIKMNKINKNKNISFVFCGQGAQSINMGFDLYDSYPIFRNAIEHIDKLWQNLVGESFINKYKLFRSEYKSLDRSNISINDPIIAQPAIFFYQYGLIEIYKSFDIIPNSVIGHSAGELAAFYASKAFSLEDCIKISYYRSIYQQKTVGTGNMLVIGKSYNDLNELLNRKNYQINSLELACRNDYNSIVLSGPSYEVNSMKKFLDQEKIFNVIIRGQCPFHSSLQDIIKNNIINATSDIVFNTPKIKLISSVTGNEIIESNYSSDYWWQNIRQKVDFVSGIEKLSDTDIFVELGPHPVLGPNIKNIHSESEILVSSNRKEDSALRLMITIADLWTYGYPIKNNFGLKNNEYNIPYIWNKDNNYILEATNSYNRRMGIYNQGDVIRYSKYEFSYMKDHVIGNKFVFPTVGYIDMINRYFSNDFENIRIKNINIGSMYSTTENFVEFKFRKNGPKLYFDSINGKINYFSCEIENIKNLKNVKIDINSIIDTSYSKILGKEAYKILKHKNFNFGKQIKSIKEFYYGDEECLIELLPKSNKNFKINPTYLDSCLTASIIYLGYTNSNTYLPVGIESIEINYELVSRAKYVYTKILDLNYTNMNQESYLLDENGYLIAKFKQIKSYNISKGVINNFNYKLKLHEIKLNDRKIELNDRKIELNNEALIYSNSLNIDNLIKLKNELNQLNQLTNYKKLYFLINIDNNGLNYGFIKSYQNEINNIDSSIIVLNTKENNDAIIKENNDAIIKDIIEGKYGKSDEYIINNNKVYHNLLNSYSPTPLNAEYYYMNIETKGNLNSLGWFPIINDTLEENHVLIDTKASALNFKDLMASLDVVKSDYIGYELSGIIQESNSEEFKVGDIVIASPNKSGKGIANQVNCNAKYVFKAPKNLNFSESASIGLIFGTTYICLIDRAQIQKGTTVLLHSALGGIGQAAIKICKMIGAEIIATAGTDEKRSILKEKYGIKYVTNSRNPEEFKKDILNFTNGKGVDVILNSLAGKSLLANFEIVAKNGIIVEIGKRDILNNFELPIGKFIDSITYSGVHFDELLETHNSYIKQVMKKVICLFEEGKLSPTEITNYHISEAISTLKYMSKGVHTGKLILNIDDWKPNEFKNPDKLFKSDKYYLITGGLGGLGIELTYWMFNKGARNFILMSRSGRITNKSKRIINHINNNNGKIIIAKINVSDKQELLNYFKEHQLPIDGIFHLAGIIKDNYIEKMSDSDIIDVLEPKYHGTNNLHILSLNYNLTHFVMFSSISALIGNPGQANYSAANYYMDKLAIKRKQEGLPSLSINVGAIGGTGMITNDIYKIMNANGLDLIHYHIFFENMGGILYDKNLTNICITNQNWSVLKKNYPKIKMLDNFILENDNKIISNQINYQEKLINHIKEILEFDDLDPNKNLNDYGIDSIISMELSNWCKDELGIEIQQIDIIQGISINSIIKNVPNNTNIENNNTNDYNEKKNKLMLHIKEILELNEDIDSDKNLINYGVDSILSMEISNFATQELGITLNQIDIMQGISINQIFNYKTSNTTIEDISISESKQIITRKLIKKNIDLVTSNDIETIKSNTKILTEKKNLWFIHYLLPLFILILYLFIENFF